MASLFKRLQMLGDVANISITLRSQSEGLLHLFTPLGHPSDLCLGGHGLMEVAAEVGEIYLRHGEGFCKRGRSWCNLPRIISAKGETSFIEKYSR